MPMKLKIICAAFLLLLCCASRAQDPPLFRIISFSNDVTLDGIPVTFDQLVTKSSGRLTIGLNSYAGVITHWGLVRPLEQGVYDVASLGSHKEWLQNTGIKLDGPLISPRIGGDRHIVGDSIFLKWPDAQGKKFDVSITDMFKEKLFDTVLYTKEIIVNVRPFFNAHREIVFNLVAGKRKEYIMIQQASADQINQLNHDLARLVNHPHKKVLTIAILKANRLFLDMALRASQLQPSAIADLPHDLKNFMKAHTNTSD